MTCKKQNGDTSITYSTYFTFSSEPDPPSWATHIYGLNILLRLLEGLKK